MGWDGIPNDGKRRNAHEHIERGIGAATLTRTLAAQRVGDTIYAAYWGEDDQIIGLVLLIDRQPGWTYYKAMTEHEGPAESKCPAEILDLLDPISAEWALEWRARCRANLLEQDRQREARVLG
jgi:hypothetical protein